MNDLGIIRIQTDWNLKDSPLIIYTKFKSIRIQTDWNLKDYYDDTVKAHMVIRIQTDWNLKTLVLDLEDAVAKFEFRQIGI